MGFFKDFKEDFSDAVNELIPGGDATPADEVMVNTLEEDFNAEQEIAKLDGLLEQVKKNVAPETVEPEVQEEAEADSEPATIEEFVATLEDEIELEPEAEEEPVVEAAPEEPVVIEEEIEEFVEAPVVESVPAPDVVVAPVVTPVVKEEKKMDTINTPVAPKVSDENAVITPGMTIRGDVESTGSIEIQGTITGNVIANGKLTVTGTINGNTQSAEFFADSAKLEGEVVTSGTAKIGVGSIIIGNIQATSAVIAGAVKGDIDVQGPVVVDTSAVVMGNIKSRSVQINNGAVIEGFCSQAYSDIDVASVFNK